MGRQIKVRIKESKDGPMFYLSLFDDRGRFVLTARTADFDEYIAEAASEYLRAGRLGMLSLRAVKRAHGASLE